MAPLPGIYEDDMNRKRIDRHWASMATCACCVLTLMGAFAPQGFAAMAAPGAVQPLESYVVDRAVGLAVMSSGQASVGEVSEDPAVLEAAARKEHDNASTQAGFAALTLLIAPLGLFSYNPQAVAAPFVLSYRAIKSKQSAQHLDGDAALVRKQIACFEKIADGNPGLRERLPDALDDGALLREFRQQIGAAIESRTGRLPVPVDVQRDEQLHAEKVLAEAARLHLHDLVDIDVEAMSLVVEPARDATAECICRIATRASVRVWNVAGSRVVFQADWQEAMPVHLDELALLLDQPRALRARVAGWYGDLLLTSMARANVRFLEAAP